MTHIIITLHDYHILYQMKNSAFEKVSVSETFAKAL